MNYGSILPEKSGSAYTKVFEQHRLSPLHTVVGGPWTVHVEDEDVARNTPQWVCSVPARRGLTDISALENGLSQGVQRREIRDTEKCSGWEHPAASTVKFSHCENGRDVHRKIKNSQVWRFCRAINTNVGLESQVDRRHFGKAWTGVPMSSWSIFRCRG